MDQQQSTLALGKDMWEQAKDMFNTHQTLIIGLLIVIVLIIIYFKFIKESLVATAPGTTRKLQVASFSGADAFTSNSAASIDVAGFDYNTAGCTGQESDQYTEDQAYSWMVNNVTTGSAEDTDTMVGGKKNISDNKLTKVMSGY